MPTPEVVPALSPAEQLAEIVKTQPNQEIESQIRQSSLSQLDAMARVIEEKRIVINESARALIRTQYDVLESARKNEIERLATDQKTEKQLEVASNRLKHLHLIRLLEIKAPIEPGTSRLDFAASLLSGVVERTKDIPVLKHVAGLLKGIRGRSIERVWYTMLATFEKNPTIATSAGNAMLGSLGLLIGTLGLNFGARKRLLEIDVLDAIDGEKLVGENITFSGVAPGDLEKFKDKLTTANIPELTTRYLRDQRKLIAAGSPITVSLEAILNPEATQKKLAEQALETKKNAVIEQLKPLNIALVTFGSPVVAKRNNAGRFEITVPENDAAMASPEVRKLQEAMANLTNAKEITIVSEKEHLTLDLATKTAAIPVNAAGITESLNRGFSYSNPRLEKIVFATPAELPIGIMQAKFDSGTLLLGAHPLRTQSLEQISGLEPLLASAQNGTLFTFQNGSWAAPALPTSIPTP